VIDVKIDDPVIEKNLVAKFNSSEQIKDYIYDLVKEDLELQVSSKQGESEKILRSIQNGLNDIKANRTESVDKLWEQLDD